MKEYYQRHNCRACYSKNVELALKLVATPVGDHYLSKSDLGKNQSSYPMDLYRCKDCSLAQLLDVVSPEILYANFIYETSISLGLIEHFKSYAKKIIDYTKLKNDSLVIDIGSNDGTLLKQFKECNLNVLGIDPAKEIANKATSCGVPTIANIFSLELAKEIVQTKGKANLICSNNTLANVDDLKDYILGIKELLADNAYFIFETGYLLDILNNYLFDTIYHEHISYFSVLSLQKLFRQYQLELVDVEEITTKGGSIRGYVQHQEGAAISTNVENQISKELSQKINSPTPYLKLAEKINKNKLQLSKLLSQLKRENKVIWGYGASVGVTTFIYEFNLQGYLSALVDDNPAKFNLFSPGHQLPVLASSEIYQQKPDYIIILAWRYTEAILKKHQEYVNSNGKFIISWPEIKIIEGK